ncbi:hypothetical protein L7F22_029040 [Adiantum nelumboides]|nr:hypothetical protein [Adiantum nelumboides]
MPPPRAPLLSSSSSSLLSNPRKAGLLFLPSGYGALLKTPASSHPHQLFLIRAVLAERPAAPDPPAASPAPLEVASSSPYQAAAARLEKQVAAVQIPRSSALKLRQRKKRPAENAMGEEDTALDSTWGHRAWVATGSLAMVGMMVKAMEGAGTVGETVGVVVAAVGAYIAADLATGIYHWGVDNYGDARTPIFGPQIDAFQGHHKRPWTIAKRQFANNIHALARPATFSLAPFLLLPCPAYVDSFLAVFLSCVVYSQQFHAWAHTKKKDVPTLVTLLQDSGLLVSRKMHGSHHRPPYNVNYCIVSGLWNPLLDRTSFFSTLEKLIFSTFHVRPRSWAETSADWLQDGSYFSDGTDVDDTSAQQSI